MLEKMRGLWELPYVNPRLVIALFAVLGAIVLAVVICLFAILAFYQTARAEAVNSLSFQARLSAVNGALVPDGHYNVKFRLYDSQSGGSPLWTEQYYDSNGVAAGNDNRLRVKNGYLSVSLGSVTAFPDTIEWNQELWLTMEIGGSAQTATPTYDGEMDPRLKLTAVPYALRARRLAKYDDGTGLSSMLRLQAPTGGDQVFEVPDLAAAGTYTVCVAEADNCGAAAGTLQDVYDGSGVTDPQIGLNVSYGGIAIRDAAGGVSGDLLKIQDNAGSATYFGVSATGLTMQDSSGNNALLFDSANGHLKIYANTTNPTLYADIYYDDAAGEAVFASSSGLTRLGNGNGNISFNLSAPGDVLQSTKTAALTGTYSADDFTITQNLTAGSHAVGGAVLKVESLTSGTNVNSTVLEINQANSSAGGALISAATNGVEQFAVDTDGTVTVSGSVTVAAGQSFLGAGALQLSAGTTALTLQAAGSGLAVRIGGGNSSPDGTPSLLVLDHKSTSGDPSPISGAIYYNANAGKFRCNEAGSWKDCVPDAPSAPDTAVFEDMSPNSWNGDNNTRELFNDTTRPNIDTVSTSSTVLVNVHISGVSNTSNDAMFAARIVYSTDGSNPSCSSDPQVGRSMISGFTTNTSHPYQLSGSFIHTPGIAGEVRYTICSSDDAMGSTLTDTPDNVTVSLVMLGA